MTLLVMGVSFAFAQTNADIKFDKTTHDFGKFSENSPVVSCTFTFTNIETIFCDCERPQRVIGQIFESARESGEEDNQTAILYVNQEKEKNKKESEVKFPKTDTRQSKKKEDICCYTELPKSKKPLSLKEKLLKNRFIGGR